LDSSGLLLFYALLLPVCSFELCWRESGLGKELLMKEREKSLFFIHAFSLFAASTLTLAAGFTTALFIAKSSNSVQLPGTVGLRSYFQRGDGSEADPFVIARPAHFYNLTRLQNLGLLGSKFHFTLGYDADTSTGHTYDPYGKNSGTSLVFYQSDSSDETQNWLDMSSHPNVLAIGSEGSPFYGIFDGNGKEIDNLSVQSGPEDVGVFGYTYSGSIVRNVYLNNISVTDNGYDSNVEGLPTLYGDNVSVTPDTGSMTYVNSSSAVTEFTATPSTKTTDLAGHFDVTLPINSSIANISYQVRSSSEYFTVGTASNGHVSITINTSTDTTDTTAINNNTSFTSAAGAMLSTRFSIIARIYKDGIYYSKVLRTYEVDLTNTLVSGTPSYSISMSAMLDYVNTVASGETGYVSDASEYAHGVNIGYLIGHCDGSVSSCYVFGGTLHLNNGGTGITAKAQESETGLIGEIGPAIDNAFTPQKAYEVNGDTGVVNFTKMYSDIAGTNTFTSVSSGAYWTYPVVAGTADKYLSLLRQTYASSSAYVGSADKTIDFLGRRIVIDSNQLEKGNTTYNYGLGVFSLVTSDYQSDNNSTFTRGLGDFAVSRGTSFNEFYYTTAEWKNDSSLSSYPAGAGSTPQEPWSYAMTYKASSGAYKGYSVYNPNHINMGYWIPSYVSSYTWNASREKNFNYIFRCPLLSEATMAGNDYFYNTNSPFLQAYFNYKLVDKTGTHLTYDNGTNADFGVFIKDISSAGLASNITSFDSSLKMSAPTAVSEDNHDNDMVRTLTTVDEDTTAMTTAFGSTLGTAMATKLNGQPARSIDFSIKSAGGANVTVMASSPSGNGGYVGVYDKSTVLTSSNNYVGSWANQRPSYAMYVPYANTIDDMAYFNYYPVSTTVGGTTKAAGSTDTVATWGAAATNRLYAHTFFLPKGDYFLGSPSGSVYIYYVCAQGQEGEGNTGHQATVFSALNQISDIDFIARSPNDANFVLADDRCNLSFEAKFTSAAGDISVTSSKNGTVNLSTISKPDNLSKILIYNKSGYQVSFNSETFTSVFKKWPAA